MEIFSLYTVRLFPRSEPTDFLRSSNRETSSNPLWGIPEEGMKKPPGESPEGFPIFARTATWYQNGSTASLCS